MTIQSMQDNSESKPPWQIRETSYGKKLLVITGTVFLVLFVILPGIFVIPISVSGLISSPSDQKMSQVISSLVMIIVVGAAIFAVYKLWPTLTAVTSIKLSATVVAPTDLGQRFDVLYRNPGQFAHSYQGKGSISFQEDRVEIEGTLNPSIWMQLGIIVVVTVVPLVLFGCGLGLIPALLLANVIGRKKMTVPVRYTDTSMLSVEGCTVKVHCNGHSPSKFKFTVMTQDGERLYRELYKHYPAAVTQWSALLKPKFS